MSCFHAVADSPSPKPSSEGRLLAAQRCALRMKRPRGYKDHE